MLKTTTWNVRFTLPKGDPAGKPDWQVNMTITCVCDTIDKAIELVREQHPAAIVYGVTHKGTEFTLFDPAIAVEAGAAFASRYGC